ncbi:glycosyltransferase family 4 protein [Sphingomonas kyeonggiensis]|uniref:Glycosyltransferase involved in cell wall biosynthesis n=1 Tax=Sphingomonas kyeonggiensis TaxID=1268553 RepID=A0A7W6NYT1_9SPHN|nr:glycosyltransferase family 4 protein [Sphingomonas kyeonggiensis]MBB4099939.1 glycosyltransferase involved in cell wall biosynthesis [Sphingomonas kyeonggiensis]
MSRPRLWVISELYYPEETSTGYFITKIAEGLAKDFDVQAVCGQPSYSERGIRAPRHERHADVEIHRLRSTHFDKDRLLLRAVNLVSFTIAVAFFLAFRLRRSDQLLVVTNPPTVPFICGWLARLRGCRSTLLVHDIYPEVLAATNVMRGGAPYRVLQVAFDHSFRLFDQVVVLGRDMLDVVGKKLGKHADRMVLIPNWGDVEEVRPIPAEQNRFLGEHQLAGMAVIQFSGNLGRTHDVELFVETAQALAGVPDLKFLAVGYGGKSSVVSEASNDDAGNLLKLPRQPRDRLAEMLNASTATMISFVDGMYGISVPSRMYNVMAAGRPIIAVAHPRSELALVVAEENAGWVIDRSQARTDLPALVRHLATAEGKAEADVRGAAARRAAETKYTLGAVIERFRCILQRNDAPRRTN